MPSILDIFKSLCWKNLLQPGMGLFMRRHWISLVLWYWYEMRSELAYLRGCALQVGRDGFLLL